MQRIVGGGKAAGPNPLAKIAPGLAAATRPIPPKQAKVKQAQTAHAKVKQINAQVDAGKMTPKEGLRQAKAVSRPQRTEGRHPGHGPVIPPSAPSSSPAQRQAMTQAKNPALAQAALAATQRQTARMVANQKPNILNADILGLSQIPHNVAVNTRSLVKDVQDPGRLLRSPNPVIDPNKPIPVNAQIVMPGPGKILGRLFGRTAEAAAPAAAVPESANLVNEALKEGTRLAPKQAEIYKAERAARMEAGKQAMREAGGGEAGYRAKLAALKGPMEKVAYQGLGDLPQAEYDQLLRHVQNHPALRDFEKLSAETGLARARHGLLPRPSEIEKLTIAFGPQYAENLIRHVAGEEGAKRLIAQAWNLPRSLRSTLDVSAPLRQGLPVLARHPRLWKRNFNEMLKQAKSEDYYQKTQDNILRRPNAVKGLYKQAKIAFTDLGHSVGGREEQFPSELAEKIPVVGHGVRFSSRAYTGFLNRTRADLFDQLYAKAVRKGVNVKDEKFVTDLGKYVNMMTGRGHFGRAESMMTGMNSLIFSPRLIARNLNLINPGGYLPRPLGVGKLIGEGTHPFIRREAWKTRGALGAAIGGTLGAGKLLGAQVGTDPRSADFAKLRLPGGTRIDISGGLQQYPRAAAQVISGKAISTTTGRIQTLGRGFGQQSRRDILLNFILGKASPQVAAINQVLGGNPQTPTTPMSVAASLTVPLAGQDAYDAASGGGAQSFRKTITDPVSLLKGAAAYAGSGTGLGIQTYGPNITSVKKANARVLAEREDMVKEARRLKLIAPNARFAPEIRQKFVIKQMLETARAKATIGVHATDPDYQRKRFDAELGLLKKWGAFKPAQYKELVTWAKDAKPADIAEMRDSHKEYANGIWGFQAYWDAAFGKELRAARKEIKDAGGQLKKHY